MTHHLLELTHTIKCVHIFFYAYFMTILFGPSENRKSGYLENQFPIELYYTTWKMIKMEKFTISELLT